MSLDPLLPIAPARVKALLLPISQITSTRFDSFVTRLEGEHVVHLRDISADGRPHRNMFSPLAYPDGAMIYDLITHIPPPSHLALTPFDLYREPMAVVALADGREMGRYPSASGTLRTVRAQRSQRRIFDLSTKTWRICVTDFPKRSSTRS
uniref:Trs120/TRAPPC9 N-terminal domain-containing protein n=1 Tax=Bionectria ochroleuca TaxID=29856 RepID=A0A8H7KC33_BIOOC